MMNRIICLVGYVITTSLPTSAIAAEDATVRDVPAVQKFLKEKFPNDAWGRGPTRLTGKAIEAAYPHARFYYVFSPQYPVAREGQISAVVQIDGEGTTRLLENPADYNQGLLGIASAGDAKTAAAAIMSLMLGPMGPQDVAAESVEVVAADGGWGATAVKPQGRWEVSFDGQGQCTAASYKHTAPLPICIGGLFRVTAVPPGLAAAGQPVSVGLLVDSVEQGSIAQRAGLLPGDLIVGFDDKPLPSDDTIQKMRQTVYILKQQQGARRSLTVLRGGQTMSMKLTW